jgi:hypothetical protein
MTQLAYKFTRPGARSAFTGYAWPQGDWVEVEGEIGLCANGIHACRPEALPRWIDDELWLVELDDVEAEHDGVLLARRGRLLERIEAWDAETSRELARYCAARVRELAEQSPDALVRERAEMIAAIADGPDPSATALAMYTTAHTFDEVDGSYYEERRRQAEWLRDRLQLDLVASGAA